MVLLRTPVKNGMHFWEEEFPLFLEESEDVVALFSLTRIEFYFGPIFESLDPILELVLSSSRLVTDGLLAFRMGLFSRLAPESSLPREMATDISLHTACLLAVVALLLQRKSKSVRTATRKKEQQKWL